MDSSATFEKGDTPILHRHYKALPQKQTRRALGRDDLHFHTNSSFWGTQKGREVGRWHHLPLCSAMALTYLTVSWEENSWPLVAHCLFNCFMVVTCTVLEETCLDCLPTAMQTARGYQHHLQPGNNQGNCEMKKPFAFISQTKQWTPGTNLHCPPQLPKEGATDHPASSPASCPQQRYLHFMPLFSFQTENFSEGEKKQPTSQRCGQWRKGVSQLKLVPTCPLLQALDPCVFLLLTC